MGTVVLWTFILKAAGEKTVDNDLHPPDRRTRTFRVAELLSGGTTNRKQETENRKGKPSRTKNREYFYFLSIFPASPPGPRPGGVGTIPFMTFPEVTAPVFQWSGPEFWTRLSPVSGSVLQTSLDQKTKIWKKNGPEDRTSDGSEVLLGQRFCQSRNQSDLRSNQMIYCQNFTSRFQNNQETGSRAKRFTATAEEQRLEAAGWTNQNQNQNQNQDLVLVLVLVLTCFLQSLSGSWIYKSSRGSVLQRVNTAVPRLSGAVPTQTGIRPRRSAGSSDRPEAADGQETLSDWTTRLCPPPVPLRGQSSPLQLPALLQLFDPADTAAAVTGSDIMRTGHDRRRNLMIFLAAWSCFLVRNDPLLDKAGTAQTTSRYSEGPGAAGLG
ncbi:hypothetical protein CCH79_00019722 [Gambusia affinis]|uniref:Uncharacterized protein n=1 Tax=Gambusia affinis TaxID=33528 RepID=A0A315V737_GAMAF|nr:hypothetical protein CCH79_00019722 [Gambusia affinis]